MTTDSIRQPPDTQILDAHHDRQRLGLHTSMPGIIVSYDKDAQTATVQPVIILDDYSENEQPDILVDVPVRWPGGGGFHMTFPLAAGDGVWVDFAENDFSMWRENGGVNAPVINRPHGMHAATSGLVCRPRSAAIAGTSASKIVIGKDDGTGDPVTIDANGLVVGAGSDPVALANALLTALQSLASGVTPASPSGPDAGETGLVTFLDNLASLTATFASANLKAD